MTLSSILKNIESVQTEVKLLQNRPKAVSKIVEKPFYIEPTFKEIKWNGQASIILFSAPGAVGKSALAKYISFEKKSLYWDLSQVKLGQHSLNGMLIEALGPEEYSMYIREMKEGKQSLVIDALDEADLISGRNAIEILLNDIWQTIKTSQSTCIVLLSRAETAAFIERYINNLNIPYCFYEIGFFEQHNSEDFIKKTIEQDGKSVYTSVMKDCVKMEFDIISSVLDENDEKNSFLGYAPVLQAIAKSLKDTINTMTLKNSLCSLDSGIKIIDHILSVGLLEREKNKIINGMKENLGEKYFEFNGWEKIYSYSEQLINITAYIVLEEIEDFSNISEMLPPEIYNEYINAIKNMICQHPFLGCVDDKIDFVGPAFRDYTMAFLLSIEGGISFVKDYQAWQKKTFIPSQMMFDFYCISNSVCLSEDAFIYIYEAFLAKETIDLMPYISIVDDEDGKGSAIFSIKKNNEVISENILSLDFNIQRISFRQIVNTSIDGDFEINIGVGYQNTRIVKSSIICKKVNWCSQDILIEDCSLIVADSAQNVGGVSPNFDIRGTELKISLENIHEYFRFRPYSFSYSENSIDPMVVHNSLKKLFGCMRGHGKDTPARDKEFVDFVIMGRSSLRKNLLKWLIIEEIIYIDNKESHLYKLNLGKASSYGINWSQLCTDNVESEAKLLEEFKKYCSRNF